MATQNYLTNFLNAASILQEPAYQRTGTRVHYFQKTISIDSSDDNGSTYLVIRKIPSDCVIARCWAEADALTGGNDFDLGLFNSETGVKIGSAGDNCLGTQLDFSSARAKNADYDCLTELTHEETLLPLYKVAGETQENKKGHYDLVLTGVAVGSTTGKITIRGEIIAAG